MAQLDRQLRAQHPGIVIGWIRTTPGDPSDHYPDDTPGLPAAQTDPDTLQEVRALDPMIGPAFTTLDADQLVRDLVSLPSHRARLDYVIWNRKIIGRHTLWTIQTYSGRDPHTGHVHISGYAGDDSNGSAWTLSGGASMALEQDLNAYVEKYEGGPGETNEPIRITRGNWRQMLGTDGIAATLEALVTAQANLTNTVEQIRSGVAALIAATPGTGGALTPMNQAQAYRAAAEALDPTD